MLEIKLVYLDSLTTYDTLKEVLKNDPELNSVPFNKAKAYVETLTCKYLTIYNENYPKGLKQISNHPYVLYYHGKIELLNSEATAVIGTNYPTKYGLIVTRRLVPKLKVLISGFSYGIEYYAQKTALKYTVPNIVVSEVGFDNINYQNQQFVNQIIQNGLLISPFCPNKKLITTNFIAKNQLIAILSNEVCLIEAKTDEFPIHIIDYALNCNKTIYVVPGTIFQENSFVCNQLIAQGANIITDKFEI